jgi:hypothetical protein
LVLQLAEQQSLAEVQAAPLPPHWQAGRALQTSSAQST